MRILYFSRDYSTHDRRFLASLVKAGHQLYYLRLEKGDYTLEDRPLPPEVELIQWAGGGKSVHWSDIPRLRLDLKRVLRQVQPDLVQAGPLQRCAFLVALCGFHPLISMSWGYDLIHDANRDSLWRWATRYTLAHSDLMVGDCNAIRKLAISFGMPEGRIVTFPWGVDLENFSPAPVPGDSQDDQLKPFTLLSTRGWEPIYGVELIARAFVEALKRRPDLSGRLHLVMLGNGSQAALLRNILSYAGTSEMISFPGQVSQANLPCYYRSADLYISASHSDGSSISLLEALACGTPALVSDIPGNREWIEQGVQGWIYPDGDVHALTEGILAAFEQRQALKRMGAAARRLAEERADWENNFTALLRGYELVSNAIG